MQKIFRFILIASLSLGGSSLLSASEGSTDDVRSLRFLHTHTGGEIAVTYYTNGTYHDHALEDLNSFLADWRNQKSIDMDPQLLDALWKIQSTAGSDGYFEVISAYRSPETNEMLRARSNGVAKTSQHLHGKAIDVRLSDVSTEQLRDVALQLGLGGVGYYAKSDFVHIDTGRVRRW